MKKGEAMNSFDLGLLMDLNPIVTPNNVVTNCLNGTLVTYNGNEHVLLNDMGNGRVETAYLPEGYVPLGTSELGGIIYIVSYNPLTDKCLIGSFPSPERNITSDDNNNELKCSLSEGDFNVDTNKGALVFYIKKELGENIIFNPGDKFIVYGDTIINNYSKLYNPNIYNSGNLEEARLHTLKLSLGIIPDSGRAVIIENLKLYTIDKDLKKYHIMLYASDPSTGKFPSIDLYRSLIELPYNIFNSKLSGKLAIIAELVQFNSFDIELSHKFIKEETNQVKTYNPGVKFNFSGNYPFIPKGVKGNFTLSNGTSKLKCSIDFEFTNELLTNETFLSLSIEIENFLSGTNNDIVDKLRKLSDEGYFESSNRALWILQYEFIPCMSWGLVTYLTAKGLIDLSKLGTGLIELNSWRYYNENNKCNLTWGLDIYEEEGWKVDEVKMDLTRLLSNNTHETISYTVNKKSSYSGIFYDLLPLEEGYFRLTDLIHKDLLYLVKIEVNYTQIKPDSLGTLQKRDPKIFYRWLYTSEIFNEYYSTTSDFKDLTLSFTPSLSSTYTINLAEVEKSETYGVITGSNLTKEEILERKLTKSSLSGIQTEKMVSTVNNVYVGIKNTYNMFNVVYELLAFDILLNGVNCSDNSLIRYTNNEDPNLKLYLESSSKIANSETYNTYKLAESFNNDVSDNILETPTNVVYPDFSDKVVYNFNNNVYTFNLNYNTLLLVKAYCTKIESEYKYQGRVVPLAYNEDTFATYNMKFDTDKWIPTMIGTYGFLEPGGDKGKVKIGRYSSGSNTHEESHKADEINLKWTTDPNIVRAEQSQGWTGPAIFSVHWYGKNKSRQRRANGSIFSEACQEYTGNNAINRVMLMFKSDKGDQCYYPIDFSTHTAIKGSVYALTSNGVYKNFYNDFAMVLNNIYRYDPETYEVNAVIPESLYYMDDCRYFTTINLVVNSTEALDQSTINIKLKSETIPISKILETYTNLKILEETFNKEPLKKNISYKLLKLDLQELNITIEDGNRIDGIKLRNKMEGYTQTTKGLVIMDYNGRDMIKEYTGSLQRTKLYIRNNKDDIVEALYFDPIELKYSKDGDNHIVVTALSNKLNSSSQKINLNTKFTLNEEGALILKSPAASEVSFKRDGGDDTGIVDGYLTAYFLSKHKHYLS